MARNDQITKIILTSNNDDLYVVILYDREIKVLKILEETSEAQLVSRFTIDFTPRVHDTLRINGRFAIILYSEEFEGKIVILNFDFQTYFFNLHIIEAPHVFVPTAIICREGISDNNLFGRCLFT